MCKCQQAMVALVAVMSVLAGILALAIPPSAWHLSNTLQLWGAWWILKVVAITALPVAAFAYYVMWRRAIHALRNEPCPMRG